MRVRRSGFTSLPHTSSKSCTRCFSPVPTFVRPLENATARIAPPVPEPCPRRCRHEHPGASRSFYFSVSGPAVASFSAFLATLVITTVTEMVATSPMSLRASPALPASPVPARPRPHRSGRSRSRPRQFLHLLCQPHRHGPWGFRVRFDRGAGAPGTFMAESRMSLG
ncbi:MAG: hypothetical protein PWP23_1087 [Candidatus Sumerlaeota bacterium]|nr:hypothetical protein [Candidatus Sumerlaeota bacterium]